jgi:NitT/TauT family transport system substrate-binding protein
MIRRFLPVLLALLLVGCAAEKPPLRIGALVWPPYELAYLARDRGFFDTDRIELVDYQTPAEVTRAYRYGLLDAYFLTTQFALPGAGQLQDSRIAYVIDFSIGGDALLARPGIENLQDLAGRRIGVEAGPLGGYMLRRALDVAGLSRGDVALRYVDTPDQVDTFAKGAVDAVITYEPYRSRALDLGARELFSSRRIPGEIVDVLMVPNRVMNARQAELRDFVRGLEKARRFLEEHPDEALPVMAQRQQLSPAQLQRALDGTRLISLEENQRLLGGQDSILQTLLERQVEVMRRAGLAPESPGMGRLIDPRLVAEDEH